MSSECSICGEKYDLNEHLPKKSDCQHTNCLKCVKKLISQDGVLKCPQCNNTDNRELDQIPNDEFLYKQLFNNIFPCFKCNQQNAQNINFSTFLAYCKQCGGNEQQNSDVISTNLNRSIHQEYIRNKHLFSFEFKNYIKQTLRKSNYFKLELYHIMKLYINLQESCFFHPNLKFSRLMLFWFKPFCQNCDLDDRLKIEVNTETLYTLFGTFFQNVSRRNSLIYGSVHFYFTQWNKNYWVPIIEVYLMQERHLDKPSLISCMYCKKGFGLGRRMPYKMDCGHLICKSCIPSKPNCYNCRIVSNSYKVFIHKSLYNFPKCINCISRFEMGYSNLPLHYYCDCIICAKCSSQLEHCGNCLNGIQKITKYNLKVSKRALNVLIHLKIDLKCWNCNNYPSKFFSQTHGQVLCEFCSQNDNNKFPLEGNEDLDLYLNNKYGNYFETNYPYLYFESLNLNKKLSLISQIISGRSKIDTSYSQLELREIDRFSVIYPVTDNDPRVLKIAGGEQFHLEFQVNVNIKICGFKLAGNTSFKKMPITLQLSNSQGSILETRAVEIESKIGYVMLNQAHEINCYRVAVSYSEGSIFTGKLRTSNTVEKDGVIFSFRDPNGKGGEFCGPILGIIYSI